MLDLSGLACPIFEHIYCLCRMKRFVLFVLGMLLPLAVSGQGVMEGFSFLETRQLRDTAEYYFNKKSYDTALVCYALLANMPLKGKDADSLEWVVQAMNAQGVLYYWMSDYRKSYECLINALDLCEKSGIDTYKYKILLNIGNIYYRFDRMGLAKDYYSKALASCRDSADQIILASNIGSVYLGNGSLDTALAYFDYAETLSRRCGNMYLGGVQNNKASLFFKKKDYDSAFFYWHQALEESSGDAEIQALSYSDLGRLFLERGNADSALHYVRLSNAIASASNNRNVQTENYRLLSRIAESKGERDKAFDYYKSYADMKDSLFNVEKFGEINQLQRSYEMSKVDSQINRLVMEQQVKDQVLRYRTVSLWVVVLALIGVSGILVFMYLQHKKLNRAYNSLVEKSLRIAEYQEEAAVKRRKDALQEKVSAENPVAGKMQEDKTQDELLDRILQVMDDTETICDSEFSIEKLAMMVQSNHTSVSQSINAGLNRNFRSFLNSYRIREAQRILAMPDANKYTIEAIAARVGFKSRSGFINVFKETTGVTPSFYLKSVREQVGVSRSF